MKKKILVVLLFAIVIIGGYFIVAYNYPKYAGRYFFLALLVIIDFYIYSGVKAFINRRNSFWKHVLKILYWLPLGTMIVSLILTPFHHLKIWEDSLKVIFLGFIITTYVPKLIPLIFYLISDFLKLFISFP